MRAVKSVLMFAGQLKRNQESGAVINEEDVLMQVRLRGSNKLYVDEACTIIRFAKARFAFAFTCGGYYRAVRVM